MAVEPGKVAYIHLSSLFDSPNWREAVVAECSGGWVRVAVRAKRSGEVADHFSVFQQDGKIFFLAEVRIVQLHAFHQGECLSLDTNISTILRESRKLKESEGELTYATASEALEPPQPKPSKTPRQPPPEKSGSSSSSGSDSSDMDATLKRLKKSWLEGGTTGERVSEKAKEKSKFPLLTESRKKGASSSKDHVVQEALLSSIQNIHKSSDPLQALLAMQIADRLEKSRRRRKASSESRSSRSESLRSSRSSSQNRHHRRGHAKAIDTYRSSGRRMKKRPLKYVKQYVREIEEELGVDGGKPYNLHDIGRRIQWGKQKSLQRTHYILSEILTLLLQKKHEQATLQTMLGLRAVHQTAIDQGDWTLSWLLTHLPNVWDRKQWGGSAEELGNVAAYLKSMEELNKSAEKARSSHQQWGGASSDWMEAAKKKKEKEKGKSKGKGKDGKEEERIES